MTVLIIIGILVGLGFLLIFPRMTIGVLAAAFCVWRGWWIAAGICLVVGFCLSIVSDPGHEGSTDHTDYTDFSDESDSSEEMSPFQMGVMFGALSSKDKDK